jgi:hypothetical protein
MWSFGRTASVAASGLALAVALGLAGPAAAQVSRHPTGLNVNASGATTVFLTFGNMRGLVPAEALWCGALVPASPDIGERCDPSTIYGRMPLRYDLSRASGTDGMTDIMTIPPSVTRRAYQVGLAGGDATFYYVRRFVDPAGGPDEYVFVTCRMTDGGARTPFSLTDVRLAFASGDAVLSLRPGQTPPPLAAHIHYNGTGRLRGRGELVRPGEDPPSAEDLLTEATLPMEQRGGQKRYTELARFDVFLPPVGEAILEGPDPELLPTDAEGRYLVLLRIEASDDKEGDSSLASAGTGVGLVHSGGVAGFPLPPVRYHVGGVGAVGTTGAGLRLLLPVPDAALDPDDALGFAWSRSPGAVLYRLEIETATGEPVLEAILTGDSLAYDPPGWLAERLADGQLRWRVIAMGVAGTALATTPWRSARFATAAPPAPGS